MTKEGDSSCGHESVLPSASGWFGPSCSPRAGPTKQNGIPIWIEPSRWLASRTGHCSCISGLPIAQCAQVDETVFQRASVAETLADFFVPVKINAREQPELAHRHHIQSVPKDVILSPSGQEIHRLVTPVSPQQYIAQLSAVAFRAGLSPNRREPVSQTATATLPPMDNPAQGSFNSRRATAPGSYDSPLTANRNPQPVEREVVTAADSPVSEPQEVINRYARQDPIDPPAARRDAPRDRQPLANDTQAMPEPQRRWGPWPQQVDEPEPVAPSSPPAPGQSPRFADRSAAPPAAASRPPVTRNAAAADRQRPPLGLDGYCPVTLLKKEAWKQGDSRYGAVHRGRLYLFTGPEQADTFLKNPDDYSPVLAGIDPVHLSDSGEPVAGRRSHGVVYRNRIYLFTSEENLQRFWSDPEQFAAPIRQAMESGTVGRLFR